MSPEGARRHLSPGRRPGSCRLTLIESPRSGSHHLAHGESHGTRNEWTNQSAREAGDIRHAMPHTQVKRHIRNQEQHHRKISFLEEVVAYLKNSAESTIPGTFCVGKPRMTPASRALYEMGLHHRIPRL